ncbi:DUF3231 family protein [Aquisalibacillus elongatus]|uniref:Uncharacterized protein DUF3231 n=1 Tax=Aquisalibacillus elongatus TaxID=485577 RepID=A0A3N5BK87_9BACI|nr:DUF3231 family protein [Aquisalibacillus elongatus]RPF50098.1 uncharacterized protein DUF3231 [Aquisalibacillus elongatus]
MHPNHDLNNLTSAEVTNLWNTYMNDSGAICHLKYELSHVEDEEIKSVLQYALEMSQSHVKQIEDFYNQEGHPIPRGFSIEEDVDVSAPRLFTDVYFLNSANQMGKIGLGNYGIAITHATREDVFQFFKTCINESVELINKCKELLMKKGLYSKTPYLPVPENVDFVNQKSFLSGFFQEKRPLTGEEIMNLYSNFERNALGSATMMGYSQIAQDNEVMKFLLRGKELANKHTKIFGEILKQNDTPIPMTWDSEVTDSTSYVYSDRKMMFYSTALIALSITYYGAGLAASPRRDVGAVYSRLITELMKYADDGAKLMIKYEWMEEPPRSVDRDELAKKKD